MLVKRKISELRVSELRSELEKRKLDNKGLKSTLLQRLQKAIQDEGGDVDLIEIDTSACPSPVSRKNSPRVKKIVENEELSAEKTVIKMSTVQSNEEVAVVEKSAPSNDGDDGEIKGNLSFEASKFQNNDQEQGEECKENSTPSLESESQNESEHNTPNMEVNDVNNSENHETEEEVENHFQQLSQVDENGSDNSDEHAPAESAPDSNDNDDVEVKDVESTTVKILSTNHQEEDDSNDSNSQDADHVTFQKTGDASLDVVDTADTVSYENNDHPPNEDDRNSDDSNQNEEDDIALEDDVLDMLDYDIEMPENAHVDNEDDSKTTDGANEDGEKDQSAKASDESGNKDSILSSESVNNEKEFTAKDGEKLYKNLWISGLSPSTRASELKAAFSRYGKVVGAKVVANARNPGARCYGFVAMASLSAANKCIIHLHKTELQGHLITVETIKQDPSTRKAARSKPENKNEAEEKNSQSSQISSKDVSRRSGEGAPRQGESGDRHTSDSAGKRRTGEKRLRRSPLPERSRVLRRPIVGKPSSEEPYRKRPRPIGERKVVIDNKKGSMSLRVNVRSTQVGRRDILTRRLSRSPLRTVRTSRFEERSRHPDLRYPPRDRDMRPRDARDEISRRKSAAESLRPGRSLALQASIDRDRLLLRKEREERDLLRMEREKLERERRQLERDRLERERLEQERLKLEHERKRELEKIEREKEEMKRLQEINRYEQSQRQRALKRMYDSRPHDDRMEGKRVDRDDRRRYDGDSRDRPSAPIGLYYRDDESSFRSRSGPGGRLDSRPEKLGFNDIDRRNMNHSDTDARYHPSGSGRRVEKYERPGMKSNFDHDRRNPNDVGGSLSYRHHDKDIPDDRKVISRERGRSNEGYRREELALKKDSIRGSALSGRPRPTDRDLREEIRQGPISGGRKGSPHRGSPRLRHRDEPPPSRAGPRGSSESQKFSDRGHPDSGIHGSGSISSGAQTGKPIPTTGKTGMNFQPSANWPGWQHSERADASGIWHGPNTIPGGSAVGRLVPPMGLPFNPLTSVNPAQTMGSDGGMLPHNISPAFPHRMESTFKQGRRF